MTYLRLPHWNKRLNFIINLFIIRALCTCPIFSSPKVKVKVFPYNQSDFLNISWTLSQKFPKAYNLQLQLRGNPSQYKSVQ